MASIMNDLKKKSRLKSGTFFLLQLVYSFIILIVSLFTRTK
jgi:hypothetical protein